MTTDTAHALGASRTFWELVERRAALTPDRPVLLQDDRTLTFEELRSGAERTAAGLHDLGVRPGTVVACSCRPASRRSCSRWPWPGSGPCSHR